MDMVRQLEQRRRAVLEEVAAIRSMRRGSFCRQYLKVRHKGESEPGLCGPYYVLTRKQSGKTVSRRVAAGQVEEVRSDVAAHRRFVALCQQYERLTEQLGEAERAAGLGRKKKRRS